MEDNEVTDSEHPASHAESMSLQQRSGGRSQTPAYPQQPMGYQSQVLTCHHNQQPALLQQNKGPLPLYYYPQVLQPQTCSDVVVKRQPQPIHCVHCHGTGTGAGIGALICAVAVTVIILLCGCWWSLICSIPGILCATNAISAASRGDHRTAKSNRKYSIGCSIVSAVTAAIGLAIGIAILYYYG